LQADGLQQLLERLTHISIIIDNEYGWHIMRAHNEEPRSERKSKSKCRELHFVVADQAPVDSTGQIVSDDAMRKRRKDRIHWLLLNVLGNLLSNSR